MMVRDKDCQRDRRETEVKRERLTEKDGQRQRDGIRDKVSN